MDDIEKYGQPNIRWTRADRTKIKELKKDRVAQLYKRGYSYSQISKILGEEFGTKPLSKKAVFDYVHECLQQWREERIADMDLAVQLELNRIDEIIRECWAAWEKSKLDYKEKSQGRHGVPNSEKSAVGEGGIKTLSIFENIKDVTKYGDTRYLEMIHKQLIERRKILGLYAPEKKDINTGISFVDMLKEVTAQDGAE